MPNSSQMSPAGGSVETLVRLTSDADVAEVRSAHDLGQALAVAVESALKIFHPVQDLQAEVDVDPDTDERRVVLDVTTDAPLDDMLRRYDQYTKEWVNSVPADKRDWVRLCFHTLRDE